MFLRLQAVFYKYFNYYHVPVSLGSGTQQGETRTGATGGNLPKPPEFPIKPQSETDRRILEILSNTAALAGKEGPQPPAKGGNSKGARSKSPAAAMAGGHKSVAEKLSLIHI